MTLHGTQVSANNDYDERFFQGLIGEYYGGRWRAWFDAAGAALRNNQTFDQAAWQTGMGSWEEDWIDAAGNFEQFTTEPSGDLVSISAALFARFNTSVPPCPLLCGWNYPSQALNSSSAQTVSLTVTSGTPSSPHTVSS